MRIKLDIIYYLLSIKPTPSYVSHDTWNSYQSMLRILKKYKMPLRRVQKGATVPGVDMSFR